MNKEIINEINKILNRTEIDERVKPLIKLYFLGKLKINELDNKQIESQINILCSKISNVEYSSNCLITAYTNKIETLTINKQLFSEGKSDEVILPVFTKFEEILNQNNRKDYANHLEDFINAGRISKAISIPISNKLNELYEMAEYCYGDIEDKTDELAQDGSWKTICSKYNNAINMVIVTGKDDSNELLNGVNLFHQEVFTAEALHDSEFEGPYKNEEYQKKAARILGYISNLDNQINTTEKNGLIKNIKAFTGTTQEMIQKSKDTIYTGNSQISNIIEESIQSDSQKISEEFIVSKVQSVIDKKTNWDSRVKHLIIPFFIRSQKIYDWDIDEFQERLNEIDLKLDKIVFEDLGNIDVMGNTAIDEIKLNSKIFYNNKNGKMSFPVETTLFHELGHNTDENKRETIKSKEKLQDAGLGRGRFYEWTNTVFERLVAGKKFYKDNNAMQLSQSGYETLAPLGSMLSCALGISEIEFAKIKDKGKDYEEKFIDEMFSNMSNDEKGYTLENLKRIKDIFDSYELSTDFSISKKRANQQLINEVYEKSLEIMQERIKNQLKCNDVKDLEEYKKNQMFLLKKMNVNFKNVSKSNGFRFSKTSTVHDIGYCTDNLPKKDLKEIANEYIQMADFEFDNNSLEKYSKVMVAFNNNNNNKFICKTVDVSPIIKKSSCQSKLKDDNINEL